VTLTEGILSLEGREEYIDRYGGEILEGDDKPKRRKEKSYLEESQYMKAWNTRRLGGRIPSICVSSLPFRSL